MVFDKQNKIYLATPIEPAHHSKESVLAFAEKVASIFEAIGYEVHRPWRVHIPNAWDLSNEDWGKAVFDADIEAINKSNYVVGIAYDRSESTAGTYWELGYAYGIKKKVIIIEHDSVQMMSLMIANGCDFCFDSLSELESYLSSSNKDAFRLVNRKEVC